MKLFIASCASVVIGAVLMLWITLPPGTHGALREQLVATDPKSSDTPCQYYSDYDYGYLNFTYPRDPGYLNYSIRELCLHRGTRLYPHPYGNLCVEYHHPEVASEGADLLTSDPDPASSNLDTDSTYKLSADDICSGGGISKLNVAYTHWKAHHRLYMIIYWFKTRFAGLLKCTSKGRIDGSVNCTGCLFSDDPGFYCHVIDLGMRHERRRP